MACFLFETKGCLGWQNGSGHLSFWTILVSNIKMYDAPLLSLSIVIPHSLLLQWRTLLTSLSLCLTFAVSQYQQQQTFDIRNSSTSTNSHHLFNFSFISFTGLLQWPRIMLSLGLPRLPKPTITFWGGVSVCFIIIIWSILWKVFLLEDVGL